MGYYVKRNDQPKCKGATLIRVESKLELLSPWMRPFPPDDLVRELQREVGLGHPLFSVIRCFQNPSRRLLWLGIAMMFCFKSKKAQGHHMQLYI
jgi:hypothetical protein